MVKNKKQSFDNFNDYTDPSSYWFDDIPSIDISNDKKPDINLKNTAKQTKLKERGKELLEKLTIKYKMNKNLSSDDKWIHKISSSGTTSDKIAAGVILIKEHPLSNLKTLQSLIIQCKKKGGKSNIPVIENLCELFTDGLLPPDRRLLNQPWYSSNVTDKHLLYWMFEEEIKLCYTSFINTLEECSKENIEHLRDVSIKTLATLLTQHPEQEKTILSLLVNKMGDPIRKIASTTVTCLLGVLEEHPNMKSVVIREIELFMNRPKISERAIYYSLIMLNQVILTSKESKISIKLTEIYFATFKRFMDSDSNLVQTRILTAILTGLNRSYPFVSKDKKESFEKETSIFYKIVYTSLFNRSTQALILLYQVHSSSDSVPDRYYRALYEKLLAPDLHNSSKISMFLNLLYRSMNSDNNTERNYAFIKRSIQICGQAKPSLICGILFLISQIIKSKPKLWTCIQQPEEITKHTDKSEVYDPYKRQPEFSKANESCLWEILALSHHYHPSVATFAKTLINGKNITYQGDPLLDFGTISFLDKFAFKNPRQNERLKGGSIMQSLRSRKVVKPLNTPSFINQDENEIDEEHKFFHKYFSVKQSKQPKSNSKLTQFDSDSESENSEDNNILAAEEEALTGNISSDDESPPEFDYDDIDFDIDDDEDDLLNDPTEEQLEALLLQDSDLENSDDELDDMPSAFAAAEEYAKLLEDDVDQDTIDKYRSKKKKKKNKNNNKNNNTKQNKSNLGKRKFKGKKPQAKKKRK